VFLIVIVHILFYLIIIIIIIISLSPNERSRDGFEETIRGRAPNFLQNVDLMYTMCRKEFGDLDLHSLRVTLT